MIIRAIPPVLLPDTVQLIPFQKDDRYGESWDEDHPITLTHVRFEDSGGIKYPMSGNRNGVSESAEYDSRLFIDAQTSYQVEDGSEQPLSIVPKGKDHVVYNGVTYQIDTINTLHVEATVHHWECYLNRV